MIIYKATNTINNKIYIGQTTKTLRLRIKSHINSALHRKHLNTHFANAIRKYGALSFKWETIDEAQTQKELDDKEMYWIAHYNSSDTLIGYNLTSGGEHGQFTEDVLNKLKIKAQEKVKNPEWYKKHMDMVKKRDNNPLFKERHRQVLINLHNNKTQQEKRKFAVREKLNKPVICLESGIVYESELLASTSLSLCKNTLSRQLRGIGRSVNGLHFNFYDNKQQWDYERRMDIINMIESGRRNIKVKCIQTGIIYNGINEAATHNNIDKGTLSRHINGKLKSIRGLTFTKV